MSVTFTTKYGGTASFTFYSFWQIAELCRNKTNYADIEVDLKAFFQKYLQVEKTWFERSKNPRYKKVIYPIERIFLANEDYKQEEVDVRFAEFVRSVCEVSGKRQDWTEKFCFGELAPVNAVVSMKYESCFEEEIALYNRVVETCKDVRKRQTDIYWLRQRLAALPDGAHGDAGKELKAELMAKLAKEEKALLAAEKAVVRAEKKWLAHCRMIVKSTFS